MLLAEIYSILTQNILPFHWDPVSSCSSPLTLLFLSKNNLVCLFSQKLNVSKGTETFFSSPRAQISTEKALMRNFQSDSMKKEMKEEMMIFFFLLKSTREFLKISCGNKEESDCLWSEGNPIVLLNFASCSNSVLPLRQNPTLWLSLKPM